MPRKSARTSKTLSAKRGRGRPPKPPGQKQSAKLTAYVTKEEKRCLTALAARDGVTLSEWMGRALLRACKRQERQ